MRTEELSDRLWDFSARVAALVNAMPEAHPGGRVAEQLLQCGTASAPKYDEALRATGEESERALAAAFKEMREASKWLRVSERAGLLPSKEITPLVHEAEQLSQVLAEQQKPGLRDVADTSGAVKSALPGVCGLDHFAIAVGDTEEALKLWRDTFGFTVLFSEDVNDGTIRLTHLDLGNTHLQLAQPLVADHPLQTWLAKNGPGLHHFCLNVQDVAEAKRCSPVRTAPKIHQGTKGKRALFLDRSDTQNVQVELTGK